MIRWLALLLAGCTVAVPDDPDDTESSSGVVTVHPERPRAHADDLVCRVADDTPGWRVSWTLDGAPFAGAVDGALPADTVPAAILRPGTTLTCTATPPADAADPTPHSASATVSVPTVVLIVLDDVGYGDLGTYGGAAPTPALDALAAAGTRFDAAYAAAPVCSPSRAGLFTGRVPSRFGFEFNLGEAELAESGGRGLPASEVTLAEHIRGLGLPTALIGKWHLGLADHQRPLPSGFDSYFGFLSGQRWHVEPGRVGAVDHWPEGDALPPIWPYNHWSERLLRDETFVDADPEAHLTDVFSEEAVAWVEAQGDAPGFLTVSYLAAHEPVQALVEHLARVNDPPADPAEHAYVAMIAAVDAGIGRILAAIEASGRADDTLVVVVSDNGCPALFGLCSNGGLAGGKVQLTEGGLRVPMIVRWPDRVPSGRLDERPVSLLDVAPTIASALGTPLGGSLDGVDLRPFLMEDLDGVPHASLAWRLGYASVIRQGPWKLTGVNGQLWLHHLEDDPGERKNLAASQASRVAALKADWMAITSSWPDPAWAPQRADVVYHGQTLSIGY